MTGAAGPPGGLTPDWLRQRALLSPGRPALVARARRWSFAELDRAVSGAAVSLAAAGVSPGDRVAILAGNSAQLVQLVHAAPRAGAVLAPLNTRLTVDELLWQMRDCAPVLLAYDGSSSAKVPDLAKALPSLRTLPLDDLTAEAGRPSGGGGPAAREVDLSAVHSIIYTSGTGGRPKGAMLTFGNHFWNAVGSVLNLGLHSDDRWLACLPLFHVGGLAILLRGVIYGIPVVLHEAFDALAVNRAIDEEGVTIVSVVSTMLQQVLEARGDRPYPSSLRCILLGGGPASRPLLDECARRNLPVIQTYGLTEAASQVATLAPEDALRKLGSAGKPLFLTQVRIEGQDGRPLPPGEPGEIVVGGPTVTLGYLNHPAETQGALRRGWLHTGDIGYLDEEGYLYVLDRRDDLVISGGENVYPAEVEEVLRSHPAVLDAGAIGVPDNRWGQVVVAVVSLRTGVEVRDEELLAFCRGRLAPYKVPKRLRFVRELPRNQAGKLLRRVLREEWPGEEPSS